MLIVFPFRLEAQGLWNRFLAWSKKQEIRFFIFLTPLQIEYSNLPSVFPHHTLIGSCRVHLSSFREHAPRHT
jgi:hypothetical protein